MKRFIIYLPAAFFTFSIGVSVFALYYYGLITDIAPPSLSSDQENCDCVNPRSFPGLSREIFGLNKSKSGYFPARAFTDDWENADQFINNWYSKHLRAMDEGSLLDIADENREVYRFLWLRTFDHPIFVRIEREGRYQFNLMSRELDGAGGYEPGKVFRTDNKTLTKEEWCEFIRLLDDANYWRMPTNKRVDRGRDGSQWILEGVKDNRYHIVDRWTPDKGEYREACIYLLKLSGRDIEKLKDDLY